MHYVILKSFLFQTACEDKVRIVECFLLLELDFLDGRKKLVDQKVEKVEALIHVK